MKKFILTITLFFSLFLFSTNITEAKSIIFWDEYISNLIELSKKDLLKYSSESYIKKIDSFFNSKYKWNKEKINSLKTSIEKLIAKKVLNKTYKEDKPTAILNYLYSISIKEFNKFEIERIAKEKNSNDLQILIISDKRCDNIICMNPIYLLSWLYENSFKYFENADIEIKDFSDYGIKDILKKEWINKIPWVILYNYKWDNEKLSEYLTDLPSWKHFIESVESFDPNLEICWNNLDDDWNWLTDSSDAICWWQVDRPVAELYIMSYCPYWLQAQKWYLEVMQKLWKVADIKIKFVQYIMHWEKEVEENLVQYCIQKEQNEKYTPYLKCFLDEWKWELCKNTANIDKLKLNSCISDTKSYYFVDEDMNNSNNEYPRFRIDEISANKAWVQWSPTFVLNWIKIDNIWRDAKSYAKAICSTFKNRPKECDSNFQDITFDTMFWFNKSK